MVLSLQTWCCAHIGQLRAWSLCRAPVPKHVSIRHVMTILKSYAKLIHAHAQQTLLMTKADLSRVSLPLNHPKHGLLSLSKRYMLLVKCVMTL